MTALKERASDGAGRPVVRPFRAVGTLDRSMAWELGEHDEPLEGISGRPNRARAPGWIDWCGSILARPRPCPPLSLSYHLYSQTTANLMYQHLASSPWSPMVPTGGVG